jgi:hypothetical protein
MGSQWIGRLGGNPKRSLNKNEFLKKGVNHVLQKRDPIGHPIPRSGYLANKLNKYI